MAWVPKLDASVGLDEPIARRIYDEPMLIGAADQAPGPYLGISMRHFEETRDRQVSVDRCGQTGVDRGVLSYLFPRARAMGDTFTPPQTFRGYLYVAARELAEPARGPAFPPIPSPEKGQGMRENRYHAHLEFPDGVNDHYIVALYLREIFANQGKRIVDRGKSGAAKA